MGRLARRRDAGLRHHPAHEGLFQAGLAWLAGAIAQQAVDSGQGEAPLPAPHRRPADAHPAGHLGHAEVGEGMENDPRPQHVLVGAVAIRDERLERARSSPETMGQTSWAIHPACHNSRPL
jgi:hypothetical protein